jgi:hypothetical protein
LLLSEGHPWAACYPIVEVWSEALIIRQRDGQRAATEGMILQLAVHSLFNADSGKELGKLLKRIQDGG